MLFTVTLRSFDYRENHFIRLTYCIIIVYYTRIAYFTVSFQTHFFHYYYYIVLFTSHFLSYYLPMTFYYYYVLDCQTQFNDI